MPTRTDAGGAATLIGLLRQRAVDRGDELAFTFLIDGEQMEDQLSFVELDRAARAIAAKIQASGLAGGNLVLVYPPGLDYITAFFGAIYAGSIPVPAYPPDPSRLERTLPRLEAIVRDSGAEAILTTSEVLGLASGLKALSPDLAEQRWLDTTDLEQGSEQAWREPAIGPDDLAFIQYTSGSTATPKGVMVSHANVLANQRMIADVMGHDETSIGMSWLPTYHDMGLVGHVVQPIYLGVHCVLMSPAAFLQRPIRWLRAIQRYNATTSGGPNFAYELCLRKVTAEEVASLDLGSWRVAYSGAEPVRAETLDRFIEKFGPCGFQRDAFLPCYGLAEATLIVSGTPGGARGPFVFACDQSELLHNRVVMRWPTDPRARLLVGCGAPAPELDVVIVDPTTLLACEPDQAGEIWVAGANIARGYWNRPEETREVFDAHLGDTKEGPFLRTGDLGFVRNGEIVVCGRLKDMIIIAGRNHYPQDIERTVEACHPALRRGCSAAFAIERDDEERLAVVVELERRCTDRRRSGRPPESESDRRSGSDRRVEDPPPAVVEDPTPCPPEEICETIRRAVWQAHELNVFGIALLRAGSIPKTSSGKIQRHACKEAFVTDRLDTIASWRVPSASGGADRDYVEPKTEEEKVLASIWSELLGVERVGLLDGFLELGGDSIVAVQVVWRARERGIELSPRDLLDQGTLENLARTAKDRGRLTTTAILAYAEQGMVEGIAPLAPSQFWVFEQGRAGLSDESEERVLLAREELDPERLRLALSHVVRHHDILRVRFERIEGRWMQRFLGMEGAEVALFSEDMTSLSDAQQAERLIEASEQIRSMISASTGPLLSAAYFGMRRGQFGRLALAVHRAAVDTISWRVLIEDIQRAYEQLEHGEEVKLPPKTTSFKLWSELFTQEASIWNEKAEIAHWTARLHEADPSIPVDFDDMDVDSSGALVTRLTADETRAVMNAIPARFRIQGSDVLLTAIAQAFSTWMGGRGVLIDVASHGRESIFEAAADVSRTVGRFTTVFPMWIDLSRTQDSGAALHAVSGLLRSVPSSGLGHGLVRYIGSQEARDALRALPSARVSISYLGHVEGSVTASNRLAFSSMLAGRTAIAQDRRRYLIGVQAQIVSRQLEIVFTYSIASYQEQTIQRLSNDTVRWLRQLVQDLTDSGVSAAVALAGEFPRATVPPQQLENALTKAIANRRDRRGAR